MRTDRYLFPRVFSGEALVESSAAAAQLSRGSEVPGFNLFLKVRFRAQATSGADPPQHAIFSALGPVRGKCLDRSFGIGSRASS